MAEPSMKGTVFANVLDELQRFVAAGKITPEMLSDRLAPEDLAIVERPVQPSAWYRISLYAQLMQLMDEVADGTSDFARQRGERSAEQLRNTGIYQ